MTRILKLGQHLKRRLGLYAGAAMLLGFVIGQFTRPAFLGLLIPVALFFMLYPMMLDTRLDGIRDVIRHPKVLLAALFINFAVCPLLITVIVHFFSLDGSPALMIGLLLYASIPCGGMVPAFTGMLKGNITLSITITAVCLLLSIIMVPLWAKLLIGRFVPVPGFLIAQYLFIIIILPMTLAGLTSAFVTWKYGQEKCDQFKVRMQDLAGSGLILMCFIMFALNGKVILDDPALIFKVFIPIASFLLILLTGTTVGCRYARVSEADGIALTFGSSAKNNALSLALALTVFGGEVAMINTIAGPMVQLPIMIIYLKLRKRL